jgi:hypothetical protein
MMYSQLSTEQPLFLVAYGLIAPEFYWGTGAVKV